MTLESPEITAHEYEQRRNWYAEITTDFFQATRRDPMAPRPPSVRGPDGTMYPSVRVAAMSMGIPEARLWKHIQRGTAGEWKRWRNGRFVLLGVAKT